MKKNCGHCHPDHSPEINRIKRLKGQLDGIQKMIEERRYCPEILIQTRAVYSAIRALESKILEKHIRQCVSQTFETKNKKETDKKIKELISLYKK